MKLCVLEKKMLKEDMGDFYRIPADNRDLNYAQYISEGEKDISKVEDYHSHNADQKDIEGIKSLLKSLPLILSDFKKVKIAANLIQGNISRDQRGVLKYNNDFDLTEIKRLYIIQNDSKNIIRGWQGHKIEQRWFTSLSGIFKINLIEIDNWEKTPLNH